MKKMMVQFLTHRSMKGNNPFNIRYSKLNRWRGLTGLTSPGFCTFSSLYYGCRAFAILYKNYIKRGYSVADFISRYAPPSENHTNVYISFVCSQLDCVPSYKPTNADFLDFAIAVCSVESGFAVTKQVMPILSLIYCKYF